MHPSQNWRKVIKNGRNKNGSCRPLLFARVISLRGYTVNDCRNTCNLALWYWPSGRNSDNRWSQLQSCHPQIHPSHRSPKFSLWGGRPWIQYDPEEAPTLLGKQGSILQVPASCCPSGQSDHRPYLTRGQRCSWLCRSDNVEEHPKLSHIVCGVVVGESTKNS